MTLKARSPVRQLRKRLGLTQQELAQRCGTNQQLIQRIEAGHTPKVDLAIRVAEQLRVEIHDLFPDMYSPEFRGPDFGATEHGKEPGKAPDKSKGAAQSRTAPVMKMCGELRQWLLQALDTFVEDVAKLGLEQGLKRDEPVHDHVVDVAPSPRGDESKGGDGPSEDTGDKHKNGC